MGKTYTEEHLKILNDIVDTMVMERKMLATLQAKIQLLEIKVESLEAFIKDENDGK